MTIETDDLLGGSIGPKCAEAVAELRKRFKFGKWVELMKQSTDCLLYTSDAADE